MYAAVDNAGDRWDAHDIRGLVNITHVLFLGDAQAHTEDYEQTRELVVERMKTAFKLITDRFPSLPAIPILGNHDTTPYNQMGWGPEWSWLYDGAFGIWNATLLGYNLTAEDQATLRYAGYYTIQPFKAVKWAREPLTSLRFICLNSQLWEIKNQLNRNATTKALLEDPAGQFAWLRSQLARAKQEGVKVHLLQHIPMGFLPSTSTPGSGAAQMHPQYMAAERDALLAYPDVVTAIFTGHVHSGFFRLLLSRDGDLTSTALVPQFSNPAISTWRGMNPAVHSYTYTPADMQVTDIFRWQLPLAKANAAAKAGDKSLHWEMAFSYADLLNVPSLNASSLTSYVDNLFTVPVDQWGDSAKTDPMGSLLKLTFANDAPQTMANSTSQAVRQAFACSLTVMGSEQAFAGCRLRPRSAMHMNGVEMEICDNSVDVTTGPEW
eukprot:GAFH01001477.1.p1 GENE.GAFH01001477.1~~GAFH01001477.1.p1  ORF type:complete len:499 (-),score=166.43 GAFH01001477.1:110-1417(-)